MYEFDICELRYGKLADSNMITVQAAVPLNENGTDVEQFGDIDIYQSLGVSSIPWPADEDGAAEGIVLRDCGNTDGVVIGARDERCVNVYGALQKGDTVLHSTDPDASAQVMAKSNRQIMLATKDSDGQNTIHLLDGKNNKIQIAGFGGIIEITKDQISIVAPGGKATILMKDDSIMLIGKVILGGITPTMNLASWASGGVASTPGVTPFLPAPNVYVSAV
jgi:hypothetical protein